jgi:hypothetical protein
MLLEGDNVRRLRLFGEDSCELVSTIEQSFGIKLSEDDLAQSETIGTLAHTVFAKLQHPVTPQCLSSVMFYKLRRVFMESFDVPRAKVVPRTSLYDLMPWKSRREYWRKVQDRLNYALPRLGWPSWLVALWLLLTASTLYFLFGLKALRAPLGASSVLVGVIGIISVLVLVAVVLSPLGREFPRSCETFGDLTKLALARNYENVAARHGMSSEKEVVQLLLQLVAAETAADVEKLSSETLFPEGLHIY